MTQLPEPLRGRELHTWHYETIVERLPDIARRTIAENHLTADQKAALQTLADDMPHGELRPLRDHSAPDSTLWAGYIAACAGQNWLDVPWFLAEMYFFRRILEATGYYVPGPGFGIDPFRAQKMAGLRGAARSLAEMAAAADGLAPHDGLRQMLIRALWGNQGDMSIWPAGNDGASTAPNGGHLLVDDTAAAADLLLVGGDSPRRIDLIADNAGVEFTGDLLLLDYLLTCLPAAAATLHLKPHPTFVSDATAPDLTTSLGYLQQHPAAAVRGAGRRLTAALLGGRLVVRTHLFWTLPPPFWELPAELAHDLNQSRLIILKGDMNYRRLVGDRHWPPTTPVEAVPRGITAPLLALRVSKAEVGVGLAAAAIAQAEAADPHWRVSGNWATAQLFRPLYDV